jgi:DNA-directed RNA polymerase specialized sigma24 family protein
MEEADDLRSGEGRTVGEGPGVTTSVSQRADLDDEVSDGTELVQRPSLSTPAELRVDFGAHLEANYQRLVAQLYAITLNPGEAHNVVQDAYSRAWRSWVAIGRTPDPSAWIRRVAVRSTIRSWRGALARFGIGRPRAIGSGVDERTRAVLRSLARLSAAERRAVVLFHMAGATVEEIAAIEQTSETLVNARLTRGRHVVTEGMADVLPDVLGDAAATGYAPGYGLDGPGSAQASDDFGLDDSGGHDYEGGRR